MERTTLATIAVTGTFQTRSFIIDLFYGSLKIGLKKIVLLDGIIPKRQELTTGVAH